jgi:hypothetical protein
VRDSSEMQISRWRRMIVLLLVGLALFVGTELQLRFIGLQMNMPPWLLPFMVIGDFISICFFLWQIRRVRKKMKTEV